MEVKESLVYELDIKMKKAQKNLDSFKRPPKQSHTNMEANE